MELLETAQPLVAPAPTIVDIDERAARRQLRQQIARLERDLATVFVAASSADGIDWSVPSRGGPRLLGLADLEHVRDQLADRLQSARRALGERAELQEAARVRIEDMLLDPGSHRFVIVRNEDIGERGCKQWHVLPRLGLVGMLMGWWRVKVSSGCPLAQAAARGAVA